MAAEKPDMIALVAALETASQEYTIAKRLLEQARADEDAAFERMTAAAQAVVDMTKRETR